MTQKKNSLLYSSILLFALFFVLAFLVLGGYTKTLDATFYTVISKSIAPPLTGFLTAITYLGDAIAVILIAGFFVIFPPTRKHSFPLVAAIVLCLVLNLLFKEVFARPRPEILQLVKETGYSFPSGHAMNNTALYTALLFLLAPFFSKKTLLPIAVLFYCFVVLIAFSRVYLGVHYITDVLGGILAGFAAVLLTQFIFQTTRLRKFL